MEQTEMKLGECCNGESESCSEKTEIAQAKEACRAELNSAMESKCCKESEELKRAEKQDLLKAVAQGSSQFDVTLAVAELALTCARLNRDLGSVERGLLTHLNQVMAGINTEMNMIKQALINGGLLVHVPTPGVAQQGTQQVNGTAVNPVENAAVTN